MNTCYQQLENLGMEILYVARSEKKIAQPAFEHFTQELHKIGERLRGEETISRKLVGLLYFIYISLESESEHCTYDSDLFLAVAKMQELLDDVFWDSPFK